MGCSGYDAPMEPAAERRKRRIAASAALTTILVVVAGCSGVGSFSGTFNRADVRYAQDTVTAHQRALALSELAATRSQNHRVQVVAAGAKVELPAEIKLLTGFLKSWGDPPASKNDASTHVAEANEPSIRGKNEVSALAALTGRRFDRAFLQTTVIHNREYIEHAKRQRKNGKDTLMLEFAADLIAERSSENALIEGG